MDVDAPETIISVRSKPLSGTIRGPSVAPSAVEYWMQPGAKRETESRIWDMLDRWDGYD